jgi:hypothetical protein
MTDKIIRGTVAVIIALLYLANIITGTTALVLGGTKTHKDTGQLSCHGRRTC